MDRKEDVIALELLDGTRALHGAIQSAPMENVWPDPLIAGVKEISTATKNWMTAPSVGVQHESLLALWATQLLRRLVMNQMIKTARGDAWIPAQATLIHKQRSMMSLALLLHITW